MLEYKQSFQNDPASPLIYFGNSENMVYYGNKKWEKGIGEEMIGNK